MRPKPPDRKRSLDTTIGLNRAGSQSLARLSNDQQEGARCVPSQLMEDGMDNAFDEMRRASEVARQVNSACDDNADAMVAMLLGRLRKVSRYRLQKLKRELQGFNAHTGGNLEGHRHAPRSNAEPTAYAAAHAWHQHAR